MSAAEHSTLSSTPTATYCATVPLLPATAPPRNSDPTKFAPSVAAPRGRASAVGARKRPLVPKKPASANAAAGAIAPANRAAIREEERILEFLLLVFLPARMRRASQQSARP